MDKIFNLQVESVADDDRVRRSDKLLLEHLIGIALKQVLPESIVLKVSIDQVTKKKKRNQKLGLYHFTIHYYPIALQGCITQGWKYAFTKEFKDSDYGQVGRGGYTDDDYLLVS